MPLVLSVTSNRECALSGQVTWMPPSVADEVQQHNRDSRSRAPMVRATEHVEL